VSNIRTDVLALRQCLGLLDALAVEEGYELFVYQLMNQFNQFFLGSPLNEAVEILRIRAFRLSASEDVRQIAKRHWVAHLCHK
jgi:hypothetical protein